VTLEGEDPAVLASPEVDDRLLGSGCGALQLLHSPMHCETVPASYSAEGAKGVQSAGGTSRPEAVAKVAEGLGGSLESF
jgi:hypothetical protein